MEFPKSFSERRRDIDTSAATTSVKIVVAGGFGAGNFGAGKTTFVGSVSEIIPLRTEAVMTSAGAHVDNLTSLADKTTTTVAMDLGRVSLDSDLILYLFGTPGQYRFWVMWDDLVRGAIGAVILADTWRLAGCFAAVDYFEQRELLYVVAINCFDGLLRHSVDDIREALQVGYSVPIITCDARSRESTKAALISVVEHTMARATAAINRSPHPAAALPPSGAPSALNAGGRVASRRRPRGGVS